MKLLIEDKDVLDISPDTALIDIARRYQKEHSDPIVLARANNRLVDLWYKPVRDTRIEFLDLGTVDGIKTYRHSLIFLMLRAFNELYPDVRLIVAHSLGSQFYVAPQNGQTITESMLEQARIRMIEIAEKDEPFVRTKMNREDAIEEMEKLGYDDKVRLLRWIDQVNIHVYSFGTIKEYFFRPMVPTSGCLRNFQMKKHDAGFLIGFPRHTEPKALPRALKYDKLFQVFKEYEEWGRILQISDVGHLNEAVAKSRFTEIMLISETLHEKKIGAIADKIIATSPRPRVMLIAGPSSSGKTTFSKRLALHLKVNKITPFTIAMDDYFVPRTRTPRLPNGDYDYENIEAIDLEMFNSHLKMLLDGEEVELPHYDFGTGEQTPSGRKIHLKNGEVLIIEGIHGLNNRLTRSISEKDKFKIYVSALTHLNIDNHNRFSTTDTRLIRRIVRDSHFRSYRALETLRRWPLVRCGEDQWIFPFQEDADVIFNSSLPYEICVLRSFAIAVLMKIPRTEPEYSEARRLMDLIRCFREVSTADVPYTSILREFVGGSIFQ
ncbi:nucleoside kinase [bacterium]|nr:nucleoside kinase [candidate division CSSED10-310 bacterium]